MTTIIKRRQYPTDDLTNESDDEQRKINKQKLVKRRLSAAGDFAAQRFIVSERQQLAVLKQLTAIDETINSSTNQSERRSKKIFRRNEHGETIVHLAARKGDMKRLKKALKQGANVNEQDNAGWTPLHEAVTKNQYKAASFLLKTGGNVNALGPEDRTPLIDAVHNNNIRIVHLLLNNSADTSVVDRTRLNDDMIAIFNGEQTTIDLSDTDNDDNQSDSSSINSADEVNLLESSVNQLNQMKFHSDSVKTNPYDFISDDEHEISQDTRLNDRSTVDTEENYRVPPLRIILARTISANNQSSNMNECSTLPTIEDNDQFLSTIQTTSNDNEIISNLVTNLVTNIEMNMLKQGETKSWTRTLRSHFKTRLNTTRYSTTSPFEQQIRRVSNRKRTFEQKYSFDFYQRTVRRKKHHSEHSNPIIETSSNSDDQERIHSTDDVELELSTHNEYECLPPNKRRLREPTHHTMNNSVETSNTMEENLPMKEIPMNGIKQFMNIRRQIEKRHESMLNEFVLPKVPKDFAETLMAKKTYLLTPLNRSVSNTTPASLGIKRLNPPSDLDIHLTDVFNRQEDERYRMKLRHQVEREKLILSHEQEILRLYGNATRSSINQHIPFSYCSILKDNEVYNNISIHERSAIVLTNDEITKQTKTSCNEQVFMKLIDESNDKYKRLSCEITQRQYLESNTLYSMQKMVWLKHIPKDTSSLNRMNSLLSERYLPKVEINSNFWTQWQTNTF